MKTNNKGFSLVELLVVIAIMAILAAIAIPTFSGFIKKAQESNDVSYLNDLTYIAKVSNAVEHADEDIVAEVTVDEDGHIVGIGYTVGTTVVTVTKNSTTGELTPNSTATDATAKAADKEIALEVASALDWDYTFNSVKGDADTYVINPANTKEIIPKS